MTSDHDHSIDDRIDFHWPDPALTPFLRWISDMLFIPHMCARAKCHRARACRGEPRMCLARLAPLVPEEAREGVKAMIEGKLEGLEFDEAREEFGEIDDLLAWQERVTSCAPRGR
jgi:hypothetical protein